MAVDPQAIERSVALARQFGATRVLVFGSAADSPETARDLDLACEGVEGWDLFRLGARLEEELRANVDLVPLLPNDHFSEFIARTGRVVYEAERTP